MVATCIWYVELAQRSQPEKQPGPHRDASDFIARGDRRQRLAISRCQLQRDD